MLSNKRAAVDFDSPEATFKRRRVFTPPEAATPPRWGVEGAFGDNVNVRNGTPNATCREHLGSGVKLASNKRRRDNDRFGCVDTLDAGKLQRELEKVKAEAISRINQAELVNQNLKNACEEQQKELVRMQHENKLLKRSVLTLNSRREEAEHECTRARDCVNQYENQIRELERRNMMLCMQIQQTLPSCRQDGFGGGGFGGGPLF
mmetsp:Transcript_19285/g.31706  ORF Transcript_19285/g.31706 Transcript_19285/m.31706 type:complete len:205 (+) Transcript_19285:233-847(+)|eukprot:CAMPEP_0203758760 /NCGR_PEP_ID=MMETSP0098-20131031/11592_1 /ASSEMBLY_ACC=CAM_ASM_000208 /TAXON_ID=96639 /ORGANISM=" , Strain NY0313808BC1" /LENGTH=204 /DNA_ID=CAMNT_0050651339 /DNA_START=248 /DNA_END=862 /DNA_ORIENTATION=-